MGEEVAEGNLRASPPRAALGESATPRCHLTIPLLVNRREDSTGSRTPVCSPRAEVTCWEGLPGPPAGLSGSSRLLGCHLNPPRRVPGAFHTPPSPSPLPISTTIPRTQTFIRAARVFSLSLPSLLFLCRTLLGLFATLDQSGGGGEHLSQDTLTKSKESNPYTLLHLRSAPGCTQAPLRAKR